MGFYTDAITGGYANGLRDEVEAALTDQGNWEYIETVTNGSATYKVWKNLGCSYTDDDPFYLYLYTASSTDATLYARVFEDWDAVNKKAVGITHATSSGNVTLDAAGKIADTTLPGTHSVNGMQWGSLPASTGYTYWLYVGDEGFALGTSLHAYSGYAGAFEPSGVISSGEVPVWQDTSGSSGNPQFTRTPGRTGTLPHTVTVAKPASLCKGTVPAGLTQFGSKAVLGRLMVGTSDDVVRGRCPAWVIMSAGMTGNIGDTITVGADTYTYLGRSYGSSLGYWVKSS